MPGEQVIVVGAGPTGLLLAAELALAGVSCRVLEKRADQSNLTRAFNVSARTLELLDARGLADDVLSHGHRLNVAEVFEGVSIDLTKTASRYNFGLVVPQSRTETVLEKRCDELGVVIDRGAEVTGLRQDADGVDLFLGDGRTLRADYVVGCDGARSAVRDALGVKFVGEQYTHHLLLADIRMADRGQDFVFGAISERGIQLAIPFGDGYHRTTVWDRRSEQTPLDKPVTLAEIQEVSERMSGDAFQVADMRWATRFLSERKQAEHYRVGRVLLAGDAAHVHSPAGGQGMNTGIGDAANLGWKLAATVLGWAPPWLLDSYETERHIIGERMLKATDRLVRSILIKTKLQRHVVRTAMKTFLGIEALQAIPRGFMTGTSIAYPAHGKHQHKLAGKRAPDVEVNGRRIYQALRRGRFLLVDRSENGSAAEMVTRLWKDRVEIVRSTTSDGQLPMVTLIRPDAYVAWAADSVTPSTLTKFDDWLGTGNFQ